MGVAGEIVSFDRGFTRTPRPVSEMRTPALQSAPPKKQSNQDGSCVPVPHLQELRVGFVLTQDFALSAFASFVDTLLGAGEGVGQRQRIRCVVLGDRPIKSSCGAVVEPDASFSDPKGYNYIVVVGGVSDECKVPSATSSFLSAAAHIGVPLASVGAGTFVLARAGLLDGCDVCISWFHRDKFDSEFPTLRVDSQRTFIIDDNRITCAGGTGVIHMASKLIEKHYGSEQAGMSLRLMMEAAHSAATLQPESIVTCQSRDDLVRAAMLTIERTLADTEPMSKLAQDFGVSERQMTRRFISNVGISPKQYRLRLRLAKAKRLLEQTNHTITEIALECGFSDCSHLSRTYKECLGVPPSIARRRSRAGAGGIRRLKEVLE